VRRAAVLLLLYRRATAAVCKMGYTRISAKRKRFAYLQLCCRDKHGLPLNHGRIRTNMRAHFGRQYRPLCDSTLQAIKQTGDVTGDPTYVSRVVRFDRTLTYRHKKLLLDELHRCCTTATKELERKLREEEPTARSNFAHSTINDAIRAALITAKRVTQVNRRRSNYESARAREAIKQYDVRCILELDASHIASDEAQRRMGRSRRNTAAFSRVFTCAGNQLVSVLGAFTIDGFEMDMCDVVEGSIDFARYFQWIITKVAPLLNPYDGRRLPNSVILMVRAACDSLPAVRSTRTLPARVILTPCHAQDNVNMQHQAILLEFFQFLGVKVCFLARYDPRCAPIEEGFNGMKYFLRYKLTRGFLARRPKAALFAALHSVTAQHACGFFRHSRLLDDFDAAKHQRQQDEVALLMLLAD
jgi:hypothetical protein